MAQVKEEPRSPCGSWGPAQEEPRSPCGPCGSWGPAQEHTHSEGWKLLQLKEEPQEFPFHMVTVKSEDDEDKSSVLHQRPTEEKREETNVWECGAEAGCSSVCEGEHLKVEEEELLDREEEGAESDGSWEWESPLRQTLSERRTASTMELKPVEQKLHVAPVKSEDDEDKSSVLHQRPTEEKREETNVWECGAEAGCSSDPLTQFHSDSEEHTDSSEDTDHSQDYSQEQAPAKRRSYAMVPPDSAHLRHKTPYTCTECGRSFRWKSHLQEHMFSHTGEKPHECQECGKKFQRRQCLKTHMLIHSGEKPFSCSECGKSFRRNSQLQEHMFRHSGEKPHKCPVCEKGFIENRTLTKHLRSKHHMCPVCDVSFPDEIHLKKHLKSHVEDGTVDQSFLKTYFCSECGKSFLYKSSLKTHMSIHSGQKPHKCLLCESYFGYKSVLVQHLQTKHHMCPVCKDISPDGVKLREHLKSHVEDGTVDRSVLKSCPECGKDFTKESHLRRHVMFVHKRGTHHKCSVCDKIHSNQSDLIQHRKHVHHMCPVCDEVFPDGVKLKEHLKSHEEDGTVDQSVLRSHSCPECGREFLHKSSLNRHMSVHTGEKKKREKFVKNLNATSTDYTCPV